MEEVKRETDEWLCSLEYPSLKKRFVGSNAARLRALGVVSGAEEAAWLVDYWCGKDIKGLIKMPLSRHWIMHIEAALRILDRLEHGR